MTHRLIAQFTPSSNVLAEAEKRTDGVAGYTLHNYKGVNFEIFYDRSLKLWTVFSVTTEEGYQVSQAHYAHDHADLWHIVDDAHADHQLEVRRFDRARELVGI